MFSPKSKHFNSGKLIANLLFKPETVGEIYSIYSGHGLTWGEIASAYERITGVKIRWCDEKEYLDFNEKIDNHTSSTWSWKYDRCYNRDVDASKVLRVTGLSERDFSSIDDGIKIELKKMGKI